MKIDPAIFRATFVTEAAEHLAQLESGLLALEAQPDDLSPIHALFRAAHSLKGSGATIGFERVARFTHTLETVLGRIREGHVAISRERISVLLSAVDMVRTLLDCDQTGVDAPLQAEELRTRLEAEFVAAETRSMPPSNAVETALPGACREDAMVAVGLPSDSGGRRLRLELTTHEGFFSTGLDPAILFRDLRTIAEVREIAADLTGVPALAELSPEECYVRWRVSLSTDRSDEDLRDIFMFVEPFCRLDIVPVQGGSLAGADPATDTDEWASVDADVITVDGDSVTLEVVGANPTPRDVVAADARAAQATMTEPQAPSTASGTHDASALAQTPATVTPRPAVGAVGHARPVAAAGPPPVDTSTLRVSTRKVDQLIDLVGELVIAQSMVKEIADHYSPARQQALQDAVGLVERNLQELQHRVLGIRMVPFATISARLPRVVRDAAERLDKRVTLRIDGEDTEVDKGVVERLADPLTHLLRNAVGHGIESPAERAAAGKSECGELRLSARHEAGGMVVELSDDGAGLDTARIRARAEAAGLVESGEELSDEQIQSLIFRPGFSTATEVNDICGRGVGLDVVREAVDGLNGTLTFHSTLGQGTTFVIRLPLTMAILDGLLLQVGAQSLVIPVIAVTEFLRPKRSQVPSISNERVLLLRGETLPIVRLADIFDIPNALDDPCSGLVLVIDSDGRRFGLLVDGLIGQSQVVLKSLEANYRRIEGILGATILADGGIALIVDVAGLTRKTRTKRLPALVAA